MISIIQIGMGPLGQKMAQYIEERNGFRTVAAVDKAADLIGTSLSVKCDSLENDVLVHSSLAEAIKNAEAAPQVALLTTVSDMKRITPIILECLAAGLPIVSTCEELSYPWDEAPAEAKMIDEKAKSAGVGVVGTGVNPGFLMDALPAFLTSVCQDVQAVHVKRFQDASPRRVPFQRKIGAGLSMEEFESKKQAGTLRHVGLTESMQLIAAKMGWQLDKTEDVIQPVVANETIETGAFPITPGQASGVNQLGRAWVNGELKISLSFQAAVGEPSSYDEVEIVGTPNIVSRIAGGVNGDIATCAITINTIKSILAAQPGLHTMGSIPLTSFWSA